MHKQRIMTMYRIILCLITALLLSACGGSGDEEPSSDTVSEPVTENLLQIGINAMGGIESLRGDALINVTTRGVSLEPHQGGNELDALEDVTSNYTSSLTGTLSREKLHIESRIDFVYPFPYNGALTMVINGKEGSIHGIEGFQSRYFGLTLPRPMYSRRLEALSKTHLMGNPYMLMSRIIEQNSIDAQPVDGYYEVMLADGIPPVRVELDPATGLPLAGECHGEGLPVW